MTDTNNPDTTGDIATGIFDDYQQTQWELLRIVLKKLRKKLIILAAVIFLFDAIALSAANSLVPEMLAWISIVPIIILGLSFLAGWEPLLAVIAAALLMIGIWVYAVMVNGPTAVVSGWLGKIIVITSLIAAFQDAKEITQLRKELQP